MSTSIRISGLNDYTTIKFVDFIPIVQSGSLTSMTTYRSTISSLNAFFAASGSAFSASWASESISASHAVNADSASFLIFSSTPYQVTSSWALTSSVALSAITASWANTASVALTSISASHAILSDSASYLYPTILYQTTCSWAVSASNATLASNALTASYLLNPPSTISSSYAGTSSNLNYPNNSTASYAMTASSLAGTNTGFNLTLINGDTDLGPVNNATWNTVNLTGTVPAGTRYAYIFICGVNKNTRGFVRVRTSSGTDPTGHIVAGPYGGSNGAENGWAFAAATTTFVTLTNSLTFDYNFQNVMDTAVYLYLIGYVL